MVPKTLKSYSGQLKIKTRETKHLKPDISQSNKEKDLLWEIKENEIIEQLFSGLLFKKLDVDENCFIYLVLIMARKSKFTRLKSI